MRATFFTASKIKKKIQTILDIKTKSLIIPCWVWAPNPERRIVLLLFYPQGRIQTPNLTVVLTLLTKYYHPYLLVLNGKLGK